MELKIEKVNKANIISFNCKLPENYPNPNLAGNQLSGGSILTLKNGAEGIAFDYCDGKPLKVFLDSKKFPEVDILVKKSAAERAQRLEALPVGKAKNPFGWCENHQSYCYGDC